MLQPARHPALESTLSPETTSEGSAKRPGKKHKLINGAEAMEHQAQKYLNSAQEELQHHTPILPA